ncbi:bacterial transcriptional activator domain-containing protein [Lysinibacillus sp. NPDC094177]|uniref:bacterial transcriptional activator domain-containing protein n=1 Tax=Lysinibacillus sp. NPDC094177 TaxID=3390580 RepID=UPI003CFD226F
MGKAIYLWFERESEHLWSLWLYNAQKLSGYYLKNENYAAAVKIQERIQSIFPSNKDSYFFLMKLYDLLDYKVAVEDQYRLLKKIFLEKMTMELSDEIERWYQNWKKRSGISKRGEDGYY